MPNVPAHASFITHRPDRPSVHALTRSMPVWMSIGLAAVLMGLASVPAQAEAQEVGPSPVAAEPTLWRCSLTDQATRLLCVAERAPDPSASATATVRNASGVPARYPLDPARPYTIDLLGPATDMPLVAQLAQFTLCVKTPNCRAVLG